MPPDSQHRLLQHFCGSSPVLRVLAWLSVLSLMAFWVSTALAWFGPYDPALDRWFMATFIFAILSGISSFCALGGMSAILCLLTYVILIIIGVMSGGLAS